MQDTPVPNPTANNQKIWWDPTPVQLGLEGSAVAGSALSTVGFLKLGGERCPENRFLIELWKKTGTNNWFVGLIDCINEPGSYFASALCFNSGTLAVVVEEFKRIVAVVS